MKNLKITGILIIAIVLTQSCNSLTSGPAKLKTAEDTVSYMIGISIGYDLKMRKVADLSPELIAKGIAEVLEKDSTVAMQEAQMYLSKYFTELQRRRTEEKIAEGRKFLEDNKTAPGVIETASGLQYKVIQEGTGKSPMQIDSISCHMVGKTLDGTIFQNTYERGRPAVFSIARNPSGLVEGLQLMKEGGKYELYVPSDLGYGPRGYGRMVGPNETLIYELEILQVIPHKYTAEEKANIEAGKKFMEKNRTKPGVKETASGLQYKVLREGTGKSPSSTDQVKCNYEGRLLSGNVFDSSYERGQPAQFALSGVIKGWTEGLQLMKEGAKYEFYIPPELAYGPNGSPPKIGPFETLIFDVELMEVANK
jgi:FKBP-type peptidyl-prolyl cis-trans isomerase